MIIEKHLKPHLIGSDPLEIEALWKKALPAYAVGMDGKALPSQLLVALTSRSGTFGGKLKESHSTNFSAANAATLPLTRAACFGMTM